MATIALTRCEIAYTVSGNAPEQLTLPEAASQTFVAGEFVYLVSGYVTECAITSNEYTSLILGMAIDNGSNTTAGAADVAVALGNEDTVFTANLVTAGTAVATNVLDVGAVCSMYADTTNSRVYLHMDRGNGSIPIHEPTYPRAMIIGHDKRDAVGDTGGRVLFKILSQYRQVGSTS